MMFNPSQRNRIRAPRRARRLWVSIAPRAWPLAQFWYRSWGLRLDGRPEDVVWYFAYGANMHDSAFIERRRMRPTERRVGRLPGYRLRFNLDGFPRGRAAPANIQAASESEVWGVLYRITLRELVRLNVTEGVPGPRYQPVELPVEDADGRTVPAISYVAEGNPKDGNPSLRYITLLRDGARAHALPDHWIAYLDSVKHAE
ncbi:MAG: gamma-glutamylcyclotransferase [Rhodospirillaceae bacterium]|nr:gamma-glutamylcyclotransferase [Rhodospirillaceae bacterium]